ncbi:MAG: mechanosensitive ion channel [Cardiobacteriaceae bacterium]|nr:mechanosensitive ion channel [Cardiobacteriaceae bacterium]
MLWAQGGNNNAVTNKDDDKTAWSALADVLENPSQRKILVAELRKLEAADKTTKPDKEKLQTSKSSDTNVGSEQAKTEAASANTLAQQGKGEAVQDNATTAQSENDVAPSEATEDKSQTQSEDKKTEAEALKTVTENARAAVISAAAWPKKVAAAGAKVIGEVGERISESWDALIGVFSGRDVMLKLVNMETFRQSAFNLLLIIVSTLLFLRGLQLVSRGSKKQLQDWVLQNTHFTSLTRRFIGVAVVSLLDGAILVASYVFANVVALFAVGDSGVLSTQSAFFIRAFVIIELLKIGIRVVFYPRYPGLRLLNATDKSAAFWNRWFTTLMYMVGYGYLVAFPLIKINLSPSLGMVFSAILALSAFIYGMVVVVRQRSAVRLALKHYADETDSTILASALRIFASSWHLFAIAYFSMLLVLTLLSGDKALPFVLQGTLHTILLIGGGLVLSVLMTQYIKREIRFSPETMRILPGIEKRLNFYLPLCLRVLRFILFWLVLFNLLATWHVLNLSMWVASPRGQILVSKSINISLILTMALFIWLFSVVLIERYLSPDIGNGAPGVRTQTLLSLFRSAWAVIIFTSTGIMILTEIGINIGPLIAGAGVFGLAVGFGAQTLVKDVITGIFFQIENAINTGDIVTVDGITGRAEHVGIRSVGIRDSSGTYHLIPFSNVTRVSNYMRGHANHIAEYGIAYRENIDEAMEQLRAAFNELAKSEMKRYILEPINIQGVSQLGDSAVMLRVSIKTTPGDQWVVGRAYNRLVKMYFDAAGIEMPYPHMQIYFGQDKEGHAPPVHVRTRREDIDTASTTPVSKETVHHFNISEDELSRLPDSDNANDEPDDTP